MRASVLRMIGSAVTILPFAILLSGCGGGMAASPPPSGPNSFQVTIHVSGPGTGTITSSPAGINCGNNCTATFSSGTKVTLTANPDKDSTFGGWGGACTGMASCLVTVSANTSINAKFNSVQSYAVGVSLSGTGSGKVASDPSGISCGTACSASFLAGTAVSLTAMPAANSTFAGWSGACTGTGTCQFTVNTNTSVAAVFDVPIATSYTLTVNVSGTGTGNVTSTPSGIDCPSTCNASFSPGTQVNLTASTSANSYLFGWGGACSGYSQCQVTLNSNQIVSGTINVWPINHIIFLAQENRSFDHYFGAMQEYWAQNGYPAQSFDGLPQFNNPAGPAPSIPGCNPNDPPPSDCIFDSNNPVTSYHLITQCIENPSPFWNEAHFDWDYNDPLGNDPAVLNGFVWTAGHDGRADGYYDVNGVRTMGYYDGGDLNYYYFMASNFGTSDRWFNPVMTRTDANRDYLIAATSQGYVYPIGSNQQDKNLHTASTIFQELESAGVSWKIYVNPSTGNPNNPVCPGPPYDPNCLLQESYVKDFVWGTTIPSTYPQNIGTIGPQGTCGPAGKSVPCDFENDLQNGTLPQVVQIEPASPAGLDEHPSDYDNVPSYMQLGANYVSQLISEVMNSQYWKDSVFILTYDEFGGLYDHVSPQPALSPDGIPPVDLQLHDVCYQTTGGTCDFTYTGYRVPLIVISPYAKQNYVSHTVADTTAILKLIETRFNLPPLTERDQAQPDMSEFFNFNNPAWVDPPTPPAQNTGNACYLNKLP